MGSEVPEEETHWQALRALTPRGGDGMTATRVLFAEQQMRDAAGWVGPAEVPVLAPTELAETKHLLSRYSLAVTRLERKIGSEWRPSRRPLDMAELRQ